MSPTPPLPEAPPRSYRGLFVVQTLCYMAAPILLLSALVALPTAAAATPQLLAAAGLVGLSGLAIDPLVDMAQDLRRLRNLFAQRDKEKRSTATPRAAACGKIRVETSCQTAPSRLAWLSSDVLCRAQTRPQEPARVGRGESIDPGCQGAMPRRSASGFAALQTAWAGFFRWPLPPADG